jgi:hypothetical protein
MTNPPTKSYDKLETECEGIYTRNSEHLQPTQRVEEILEWLKKLHRNSETQEHECSQEWYEYWLEDAIKLVETILYSLAPTKPQWVEELNLWWRKAMTQIEDMPEKEFYSIFNQKNFDNIFWKGSQEAEQEAPSDDWIEKAKRRVSFKIKANPNCDDTEWYESEYIDIRDLKYIFWKQSTEGQATFKKTILPTENTPVEVEISERDKISYYIEYLTWCWYKVQVDQ